jgi:uncharacterized membrane protein YukC
MLLVISLSFTSCSIIEGIFKAGIGVGIFIVVAVIAIIILLLAKFSAENKQQYFRITI